MLSKTTSIIATAALLFGSTVRSQEKSRESIDFEGIRIEYPKEEADVVELLKPVLLEYRISRQRSVGQEAAALLGVFSDLDTQEKLGARIGKLMARETPAEGFGARFQSHTETLRKLADAWQIWSGDISEVYLWNASEATDFRTREDGSENSAGMVYRFPQISFGKDGSQFSLHPPFVTNLIGLDALMRVGEKSTPLRLDLPLFYKAGTPVEEVAKYSREFINHLAGFHREKTLLGIVGQILPNWIIEEALLSEIEATCVTADAARDTALAEALARNLLFVQILNQQGEEKTMQQMSRLFPFSKMDSALSNADEVITVVETIDPLAPVSSDQKVERLFARNLMADALVQIAQKSPSKNPVFHRIKEAGIAIPEGGFDMVSFSGAVDEAYGEKGLLKRVIQSRQREIADQLRGSASKLKVSQIPKVTPAPEALPNREVIVIDGITMTFPSELKEAMVVLGPEYAIVLKIARVSGETLKKKVETPVLLEVNDEDLAAYTKYGLEADAGVVRGFAAGTTIFTNAKGIVVRLFLGNEIDIWFKEDLIGLLKVGRKIEGFSLNPDGKTVSWSYNFGGEDRTLSFKGTTTVEEVKKRIEEIPPPVYPIILKREDFVGKLGDPEATAAQIRKNEGNFIQGFRMAEEDPIEETDLEGLNLQLMSAPQAWFLVVHEGAELAILKSTIRSADRRWFCDGMANWIAIRDVDRRFGSDQGAEAFAKNYKASELKKKAGKVNLLAWPTVEDIENGITPPVGEDLAHYYFATLVIEKACEGEGEDFVKRWIEEIRRTPLNRTNSDTILESYQTLTGKDLKQIIGEVVK